MPSYHYLGWGITTSQTISVQNIRPNKIIYLILRPFLSKSDEGMRHIFKKFIEVKIVFFFKLQYMLSQFFVCFLL